MIKSTPNTTTTTTTTTTTSTSTSTSTSTLTSKKNVKINNPFNTIVGFDSDDDDDDSDDDDLLSFVAFTSSTVKKKKTNLTPTTLKVVSASASASALASASASMSTKMVQETKKRPILVQQNQTKGEEKKGNQKQNQNRNRNRKQKRIKFDTDENNNNGNANTNANAMNEEIVLSPEDIEKNAQILANLTTIPKSIHSPSVLYWKQIKPKQSSYRRSTIGGGRSRKRRRNSTHPNAHNTHNTHNAHNVHNALLSKYKYIPCRECHPDEIIGLALPQTYDTTKKVLVEHFEIGCKLYGKELINRSLLLPYCGEGVGDGDVNSDVNSDVNNDVNNDMAMDIDNKSQSKQPTWDEGIMKQYMNQIRKKMITSQKSQLKQQQKQQQQHQQHTNKQPKNINVEIRAMELYLQRILECSIQREQQRKKEEEDEDEEEEINNKNADNNDDTHIVNTSTSRIEREKNITSIRPTASASTNMNMNTRENATTATTTTTTTSAMNTHSTQVKPKTLSTLTTTSLHSKQATTEYTKEQLLSRLQIGSKITVHWPEDDQDYNAIIISKQKKNKKSSQRRTRSNKHTNDSNSNGHNNSDFVYTLEYDCGQIEKDCDLCKVEFKLVNEDGSDETDIAPTTTTICKVTSSSSSLAAITASSASTYEAVMISQEFDCSQEKVIEDKSDDDVNADANTTNGHKHETNSANNSDNDNIDDNAIDNSDDDEYFSDFEEQYKHKSEPIRPLDIIEYYKPSAVFGDRRFLEVAQIQSVDPRRKHILRLSNADYLDADTKVKRIMIVKRGKVMDYDGGGYKMIKEYKLRRGSFIPGNGESSTNTSSIRQEAKRLASIIKKHKTKMIENVKESGLGDCTDFLHKVGK